MQALLTLWITGKLHAATRLHGECSGGLEPLDTKIKRGKIIGIGIGSGENAPGHGCR